MSNVTPLPPPSAAQRRIQPFDSFTPAVWHGREVPRYDWMVEDCFLRGTVAMLSGDGGLGKSLLMQQLCTAAALGRPWLGLSTIHCRTFAFFCEDDMDELHRRQAAINRHYDCDYPDLDGVTYAARVGRENVLLEFDRRTDQPKYMPLFDQLAEAVTEAGAQIVVLDTLADVFAGNEIIRNQVRRFVTALRRLAMQIQGVIVLTAHPSLTGLNSGSGISGSTAWNNSVRSRLYLTRPKTSEDEMEDNDERLLKTMKNNQGAIGGKLRIRWEQGVFVRADQGDPGGIVTRLDADQRVAEGLRYLISQGTMVAADPSVKAGLVNIVRRLPSCRDLSYTDAIGAQERLIASGRIVKVELGSASKRRIYIRPSDMRMPGERPPHDPETGEC